MKMLAARRAIATFAVVGLVFTACGDDDGDGAAETDASDETDAPAETEPAETDAPAETEPPATEPPVETDAPAETEPAGTDAPVETEAMDDDGAGGDAGEFCANALAIQQVLGGPPDADAVSEISMQLIETSPPELADAVASITGGIQQMADSGFTDFSAMETPEVQGAVAQIDPWLFDNCPFDTTADIVGVEYAYEGAAAEYPVGTIGMRFTNEGNEAHELALVRKKEGVDTAWEELFQLPEEEVEGQVDFLGQAFTPATGDQSLVVADLTPGEYVIVCFLPVGSVADGSGGVTFGEGPPHVFEGMFAEFTVS